MFFYFLFCCISRVQPQTQLTQTAQSTANNQTTTESSDANTNAQHSSLEHSIDSGNGSVDQQPQNYQIDAITSNIEEPQHTPVVSANADGPSVDITPKQPKNVKRKYVQNKTKDE